MTTDPAAWGGLALAVTSAYLVGAVPFGLLAGRLRGVDLRRHGSGNLGATNAWRVLGPLWGLGVLALDAGKGIVPTALFARVAERLLGLPVAPGTAAVLCGLAAILGHVFPVYLGFRGKGVATSAGVLAWLHPAATGLAAAAWLVVVLVTRYVSLGSLVAAVVLPAAILWWERNRLGEAAAVAALAIGLAVLVFVRHRSNIGRLLRGEEHRMGAKRTAAAEEGGASRDDGQG